MGKAYNVNMDSVVIAINAQGEAIVNAINSK